MSKKKILLLEPNYKNKYPPMGLMKLAMYHRMQGYDVRFYKGDLKDFTVEAFAEIAVRKLNDLTSDCNWMRFFKEVCHYIKKGIIEPESPFETETRKPFVLKWLGSYRKSYLIGSYPEEAKYHRILITTLFTFYWDITIETINVAKKFLKSDGEILVGGV